MKLCCHTPSIPLCRKFRSLLELSNEYIEQDAMDQLIERIFQSDYYTTDDDENISINKFHKIMKGFETELQVAGLHLDGTQKIYSVIVMRVTSLWNMREISAPPPPYFKGLQLSPLLLGPWKAKRLWLNNNSIRAINVIFIFSSHRIIFFIVVDLTFSCIHFTQAKPFLNLYLTLNDTMNM